MELFEPILPIILRTEFNDGRLSCKKVCLRRNGVLYAQFYQCDARPIVGATEMATMVREAYSMCVHLDLLSRDWPSPRDDVHACILLAVLDYMFDICYTFMSAEHRVLLHNTYHLLYHNRNEVVFEQVRAVEGQGHSGLEDVQA